MKLKMQYNVDKNKSLSFVSSFKEEKIIDTV